MAPREGKPVDRTHIKKDLLGAAQRLAQHHKHLSADELRELDTIVDQLAHIHTDDACVRLRRNYSDLPAPPWGTRYAFWWQRAGWWISHRFSGNR